MGDIASGYLHPLYAASLAEFGEPRELRHSEGWILVRQIPGTAFRDAMGIYPLFCCRRWKELERDLEELPPDLVSLSMVTDPFGEYEPGMLAESFDRVVPFKSHCMADTSMPMEELVSKRHREDARRALRKVRVEVCADPPAYLDIWCELFSVLVERHQIRGLRAFSRNAFAKQLQVPGLVMFKILHGGEIVGLDLWYVQDDVAQGHLAAFSNIGYERHASYAAKWVVIEYFREKVRWINFGGIPGNGAANAQGLNRFKQGWSSGTRTAYLCTKVMNHQSYQTLQAETGSHGVDYFPSYRQGELL